HGIVADSWYDRVSKSRVTASNEALLATTLMAEMAEGSHARVSVVSMNSGHARVFAGSARANSYWMDERGQFQCNGEPPEWLKPFNDRVSPEKLRGARWNVPGARADAPPLRTLLYDGAHPDQFFDLYRASPFAQDAQYELASELIAREGLGQQAAPDVLCILAGSTELLGYETGARSALMDQMVLGLDRRLEALLAQLKTSPGEGAYSLVLTAAHGAPDLPAEHSRARMAVDGEALARRIDSSLKEHGLGR